MTAAPEQPAVKRRRGRTTCRVITFRAELLPLSLAVIVLAATAAPAFADGNDEGAEPVSFRADIAPILVQNCQQCHGPREASGRYRLDTFARLLEPGGSFPSVTPGDPEESELYLLVSDPEPDMRMPPDADPLPEEQIELIRRWIAEGAEYDGEDASDPLVRIVPAPEHPPAPESYRRPAPITALAFSPDGSELAASGYHEVTVWDVETGELVRRIGNAPRRIYAIAWNDDGRTLAVAGGSPGESGEVRLFDPTDGELLAVPLSVGDLVLSLDFSPDGRSLATGAADQVIRILDVESGSILQELTEHSGWVMAVRYDRAGERLASASRDGTAKTYDLETGESLTTFREHGGQVFDVGFRNGDDQQVVTVGADSRLRVWRSTDGNQQGSTRPSGEPLQRLMIHGDRVYTAGADGRVRLHRINLEHIRTYEGEADWLYALAFHEESGRLAAAGFDGHITIWQPDEDEALLRLPAAPGYAD